MPSSTLFRGIALQTSRQIPKVGSLPLTGSFIQGKVVSSTEEPLPIHAPGTGEVIGRMVPASKAQVDEAVTTAEKAFEIYQWGPRAGMERRSELLWSISQRLADEAGLLGQVESINGGKPRADADMDIQEAIRVFRYYAGVATQLPETHHSPEPLVSQTVLREPRGVCALIVPFNYPLVLAAWKVAPALACGNAIVLKPALETPLTALHLGRICAETGLSPPGLLSVLPGGGNVGEWLVGHPGVKHVSFTGSPRSGRQVALACHAREDRLIRPTLELGGKNTIVIDAGMEDRVEEIAKAIFDGAFGNAGQNCCAASRVLVHEGLHHSLLSSLQSLIRQAKLGVGKNAQVGPMISAQALERAKDVVQMARDAHDQGRSGGVVQGGKVEEGQETGYYLSPTLLLDIPDTHDLATKEHFAPILASLKPFSNLEEAISRVNATGGCIASGIWTPHPDRAHRFTRAVRAGTVWVNGYNATYPWLPFGGAGGGSGYGRDLGMEAIHEFSSTKSVTHFHSPC
ncbi:aldehyde dehydrogenase domain-containing protein [Piptocephalis cylindrospora]|uniref:Aldehyde dehydrogenase domain-containing protein n=1 Tax=Piptocephalis cylindrospora TaxID=1907219 RepID=A0A4V1IXP8_9FUNG|nr:aldehyde dehydrogenase domain-containing protein [Piptocephalis cylindrospora]|eukprot:RKP11809.1 aldehyde dehydrogenase domain-containing protein [Piptocephalis cylindrospora]